LKNKKAGVWTLFEYNIAITCLIPFLEVLKQIISKPIILGSEIFYISGLIKDLIACVIWAMAIYLYYKHINNKNLLYNKTTVFFAMAWLFWITFLIFISDDLMKSVWAARQYVEFLPLFIIALISSKKKEISDTTSCNILIVYSVAVAIIGLIRFYIDDNFLILKTEFLNLDQLHPIFEEMRLKRFTSLALNPNETGVILFVGLIAGIAHIARRGLKLWVVFCLLLCLYCLFLTYSRSAWLGLATGFSIFFIVEKRTRKYLLFLFLITIILFLNVETIRARIVLPGLWDPRFVNWSYAFNEITSSLKMFILGKGLGSLGGRISFNQAYTTLDNSYLMVCYEQGIIGLILLISFCFSAIRKTFIKKMDVEEKAFLSIFISLLVSNLFSPTMLTPWGNALFWLSCGFFVKYKANGHLLYI